jgi:phospholipid/cholesterol/gamma-HCH transport system substrate-binding protein
MNGRAVEILMGTLVLAIAGGFLVFAYSIADIARINGYRVAAEFDRADGIGVGTDVRISGVKVGSVIEQALDPDTYYARVVMSIRHDIRLPEDSSVKVRLDGLLGGAYLAIEPGGSDQYVAEGGRLEHTQGSIDVVGLLGQAIFSPSPSSGSGGSGEGAREPANP